MERENTFVKGLRDRLENTLLKIVPNTKVNGDRLNRLPNTANISFEFVEGEGILLMMDEFGICASSGSACTSGSLQPSHVLRAMGIPFTMAHGSIRFSLSIYNTDEEMDFVIEKLPPIIDTLRGMSPYGNPAPPGPAKALRPGGKGRFSRTADPLPRWAGFLGADLLAGNVIFPG